MISCIFQTEVMFLCTNMSHTRQHQQFIEVLGGPFATTIDFGGCAFRNNWRSGLLYAKESEHKDTQHKDSQYVWTTDHMQVGVLATFCGAARQ